jgi:hypothetical protein
VLFLHSYGPGTTAWITFHKGSSRSFGTIQRGRLELRLRCAVRSIAWQRESDFGEQSSGTYCLEARFLREGLHGSILPEDQAAQSRDPALLSSPLDLLQQPEANPAALQVRPNNERDLEAECCDGSAVQYSGDRTISGEGPYHLVAGLMALKCICDLFAGIEAPQSGEAKSNIR